MHDIKMNFFLLQLAEFLPPDPVPEPPHICMVFDAYKKRDVFEVIAKYSRDVIAHGFFTSGDPKSAELIAKTGERYVRLKPNVNDKLILKVAKATSHAMLALTAVGPCYLSQNAVEGQEECAVLFPPNYSQIEEEAEAAETKKKHKKKRRGKKSDTSVSTSESATSSTPTADQGADGQGEELGTIGEGSTGEEGETTSSSTNSPEKIGGAGEEGGEEQKA